MKKQIASLLIAYTVATSCSFAAAIAIADTTLHYNPGPTNENLGTGPLTLLDSNEAYYPLIKWNPADYAFGDNAIALTLVAPSSFTVSEWQFQIRRPPSDWNESTTAATFSLVGDIVVGPPSSATRQGDSIFITSTGLQSLLNGWKDGSIANRGIYIYAAKSGAQTPFQVFDRGAGLQGPQIVPEPSSALLVLLGTTLVWRRKRNDRNG